MSVQPDLLVRDALLETFQAANANPSLLIEEVFPGRPEAEQHTILDYFVSVIPKVALGYPIEATEVPGVFITLAQASEDRQTVGSDFDEIDGLPNTEHLTEVIGTHVRESVSAECWARQAEAASWLQRVVGWGLLRYRADLQDAGFHEQTLALSGFQPVPEGYPEIVFRRDVIVSGVYPFTVARAVLKIKAVKVTAHGTNAESVFTVVDRERRRPGRS